MTDLQTVAQIADSKPVYELAEAVPGAGDRQAHYLRDIGIETVGDLRAADQATLKNATAVNGTMAPRLKAYADGIGAIKQLGTARLRVLEYEDITTIDDLAECSRADLLALPTFGALVVNAVSQVIKLNTDEPTGRQVTFDEVDVSQNTAEPEPIFTTELSELFG